MSLTDNEGKSVVAERLIRNIKKHVIRDLKREEIVGIRSNIFFPLKITNKKTKEEKQYRLI